MTRYYDKETSVLKKHAKNVSYVFLLRENYVTFKVTETEVI